MTHLTNRLPYMEQVSTTRRMVFVDNLRGVLILLVVMGHSIQYMCDDYESNLLFRAIYSFHMPLFMMVSGFVSYRKTYDKTWLFRRAKQLLVPFIVGTFLMAVTQKDGSFFDYFLYPLKGLWFLWVLFSLSLGQYICNKLGGAKIVIVVFVIISALSFKFKGILCLDLIAYHFIFYATGYIMRKNWASLLKMKKSIIIIIGMLLSLVFIFTFDRNVPSYFPIRNIPLYVRIVPCFISFSVFMSAANMIDISNKLLLQMGTNTLGIYLLHRVLLEYVRLLDIQIPYMNNAIFYTVVLAVFVILSFISLKVSLFLTRNKVTALLFCGK